MGRDAHRSEAWFGGPDEEVQTNLGCSGHSSGPPSGSRNQRSSFHITYFFPCLWELAEQEKLQSVYSS